MPFMARVLSLASNKKYAAAIFNLHILPEYDEELEGTSTSFAGSNAEFRRSDTEERLVLIAVTPYVTSSTLSHASSPMTYHSRATAVNEPNTILIPGKRGRARSTTWKTSRQDRREALGEGTNGSTDLDLVLYHTLIETTRVQAKRVRSEIISDEGRRAQAWVRPTQTTKYEIVKVPLSELGQSQRSRVGQVEIQSSVYTGIPFTEFPLCELLRTRHTAAVPGNHGFLEPEILAAMHLARFPSAAFDRSNIKAYSGYPVSSPQLLDDWTFNEGPAAHDSETRCPISCLGQ
ncbi:hypothetical protein F5141DRAFT_1202144 [Pisolithus sp. B1]|nr:hypothetical protein F5141DRAFT_1202144 [Pisolithus sp. B1]